MDSLVKVWDRNTRCYRTAKLDAAGRPVFIVNEHGEDYQPAATAPPRQTVLQLFGPILADGETGKGFTAGQVIDALNSIRPGTVDEIVLQIDSTGGSFEATQRIIDALAERPEKKIGIVVGVCFSGAFLIFMACDERQAIVNASLMMHDAHVAGCIALTRTDSAWAAAHIAKRLPEIPKTTIQTWCDARAGAGVYFGAVQAEKLGIVHRWTVGQLRSYRPVADHERPFKHSGAYNPAACQCAECRAKRASTPEPVAKTKPEPIALPPIPTNLRGGFLLVSKSQLIPAPASGPSNPADASRREGLKQAWSMLEEWQRGCMARAKARAKAEAN
jgi:ATP-dependent protease ClpP protease subunit